MKECPRCGSSLSAYSLSDVEAYGCDSCGWVGVPVDHQSEPKRLESWQDAIQRFQKKFAADGLEEHAERLERVEQARRDAVGGDAEPAADESVDAEEPGDSDGDAADADEPASDEVPAEEEAPEDAEADDGDETAGDAEAEEADAESASDDVDAEEADADSTADEPEDAGADGDADEVDEEVEVAADGGQ